MPCTITTTGSERVHTWNLSSDTWNSVQNSTENFSSITLSVPFFSVLLILFS